MKYWLFCIYSVHDCQRYVCAHGLPSMYANVAFCFIRSRNCLILKHDQNRLFTVAIICFENNEASNRQSFKLNVNFFLRSGGCISIQLIMNISFLLIYCMYVRVHACMYFSLLLIHIVTLFQRDIGSVQFIYTHFYSALCCKENKRVLNVFFFVFILSNWQDRPTFNSKFKLKDY